MSLGGLGITKSGHAPISKVCGNRLAALAAPLANARDQSVVLSSLSCRSCPWGSSAVSRAGFDHRLLENFPNPTDCKPS